MKGTVDRKEKLNCHRKEGKGTVQAYKLERSYYLVIEDRE